MYTKMARGLRITFDNIRGNRVDSCRKYLEKTQWLKKQDLKRLQLKRLKALLRHAYENVPHYHESFKNNKFRPSDLKSLKDLNKVPILKKSEVRNELVGMMANNCSKKELEASLTSGTTATPLKFYRSKVDLSWGSAAAFRAYGWAGYKLGDKTALIWGFEPEQIGSFEFKLYHLFMRHKILNVKQMSEEAMASFASKMVTFKPDFVQGYSSSTNLFATFLLQNKQFKIRPKAVFASAATLLSHYRKTIEKAFNCKVYDFYGSREISSIAAQCGHHEGLHVSEENIILEIIKNNEPVFPGETGQILLTNLHSYPMPFIRYDIGDLGKIFPDTCSCGRELSLVKPVGRTYEHFVNSDGSFTYLRDFQLVFEDLPIIEFQVVQESYDEIVIKIVAGPGFTHEHTDFILNNIKLRGKAKIRVELVNSILKEKAGKIRHIVRKLSSKYT